MNNTAICPCGIHRDDCDYHKPAPESEPIALRAAQASEIDTQTFIRALDIMGDGIDDSEAPTVRFRTWSSSVVIGSNEFANDPITKIAEQISRYHAQQRQKLLIDWMRAYFA